MHDVHNSKDVFLIRAELSLEITALLLELLCENRDNHSCLPLKNDSRSTSKQMASRKAFTMFHSFFLLPLGCTSIISVIILGACVLNLSNQ